MDNSIRRYWVVRFIINLYRKVLPNSIRNRITPFVFNGLGVIKGEKGKAQHKVSFGIENPDKIFYLIRGENKAFGLFAIMTSVMEHVQYAKSKGWIPVVDYLNYYNAALQDYNNKYKENGWEIYFDNTSKYSLNEIYKSKNVVLCSELCNPYCKVRATNYDCFRNKEIYYLHSVYTEFIHVKRDGMELVEDYYKNNLKGKKVLGISYRHEFKYIEENNCSNAYYHPKQAEIKQYFSDIDRLLKKEKFDYIFLVVDDREAFVKFREKYNEKCLYYDRKLPYNKYIGDVAKMMKEFSFDNKNEFRIDVESETKKYLFETMLLSRCDGLLASMSGNVKAALIMNGGKYSMTHIYNRGRYAKE